jgi:hypothetical protein
MVLGDMDGGWEGKRHVCIVGGWDGDCGWEVDGNEVGYVM